jgi:hypothetical protein
MSLNEITKFSNTYSKAYNFILKFKTSERIFERYDFNIS